MGNEFDLKPPHYQRWLQRLMCIWSKAIVINGIIHLLYAWAHWGSSTNLCLIKIHNKIYIEIKFSNLDTQKKLELLKHCNKVDCWIMLASFKSTNKFIIIEYELFNDVLHFYNWIMKNSCPGSLAMFYLCSFTLNTVSDPIPTKRCPSWR